MYKILKRLAGVGLLSGNALAFFDIANVAPTAPAREVLMNSRRARDPAAKWFSLSEPVFLMFKATAFPTADTDRLSQGTTR